jgi:nickel-dependent lactate racemase
MWHSLETIAARIGEADERSVHLTCEANDARARRPAAAALRALAHPLDYPPLGNSTVPGDRVAIAVDGAVPRALEIVQGAVHALAGGGVEREAISIVTASGELADACRGAQAKDGLAGVQVVLHDPADANQLCLVGLMQRREPLLLNRTIFDADMVLPIGLAREGSLGAFDSLFPQFSNAAAVDRYRTPASGDSPAARAAQRRETKEAGWLIGAPLVMRVVPGPKETIRGVVAGEPQAVARRSRQLYRRQWSCVTPHRANLIVATVMGGPLVQTWANVGRALAAAERLVADDGAVAICTNLDRPIGESLGRLVGSSDAEATTRQVFHEHAEDSVAAWQVARSLARGPVYLLSQLEATTVEDLGMAPAADIDELVRLAGHYESCIVLDDAHYALASVEED